MLKMQKVTYIAACLTAISLLVTVRLSAAEQVDTITIDKAVISQLRLSKITSNIETHLDLTKTFNTKSQWTLVVAKQPDNESETEDGAGNHVGAFIYCFVKHIIPDCTESMFVARLKQTGRVVDDEHPFYVSYESKISYSEAGNTNPLIKIKACTYRSGDGDCGIATFLFAYDRVNDNFQVVFFNITGHNNNQETRFVESGALVGNVIVAYPTTDAPFSYYIEVHKQGTSGAYKQILKYRGKTRYNDGNPLSVIDSQMPETLRLLGLWKAGDALPVPPKMPAGCSRLVMRKNVEWCVSNYRVESTHK